MPARSHLLTGAERYFMIALITGASRGIGAAAAKKLADAGFLVLVHYHRAAAAAAQIAAEEIGSVSATPTSTDTRIPIRNG